jgi:hypothetical protein
MTCERKGAYDDELYEDPLENATNQHAPALDEEDADAVKRSQLKEDIDPTQKAGYGDDVQLF